MKFFVRTLNECNFKFIEIYKIFNPFSTGKIEKLDF